MSNSQKPLIVYVDDEPRNLTVLEAIIPDEWQMLTFESAVEALKKIKELNPIVIISDQKMPQMSGLEFLEIAAQILPQAIRIVVTGQTDEATMIQLIRRAKIFDYITKPWDPEALLAQVQKAIEFRQLTEAREAALKELEARNLELVDKNKKLNDMAEELKKTKTEIEAWVPRSLVSAVGRGEIVKLSRREVVGITYDIVKSSAVVNIEIEGTPVRTHVLRMFTECLIKKGGVRESSAGDAAYGHFGAFEESKDGAKLAFAVAQEFRVMLRGFSVQHKVALECGIAIHIAKNTLVQVHEINVDSDRGRVIQKSFDTSSAEIDLLFRMESLTHTLPGSNIVFTEAVLKVLGERTERIRELGELQLRGQSEPKNLFVLLSDRVSEADWAEFVAKCDQYKISLLKAA